MTDLPTVITSAGLQPQAPADLRAQLVAIAEASDPGLTTNLPAALIEDVASTDTGALVVIDQARVDFVNSLTPFGSNPFLTTQLGNVYGTQQGTQSNASVQVVFSSTNVGFVIPQGFVVSDGAYQYTIPDGGVIGADETSGSLFALCTVFAAFTIPANSVTTIVTPLPTGITMTVTNPAVGTPAGDAETEAEYRAAVLQAGVASAQGMTTFLKTVLRKVSGVQARLVTVRQRIGAGWEVIVGGGDPYQVAYAIFFGLFDINNLVGSVLSVTAVTKATPGVVTTDLNHGYATGQQVTFNDVGGMVELNGNTYTATVITEKTFSIDQDTSGYTTYTSGGVLTPNLRNEVVSLNNYPDVYEVQYVQPPQQSVNISILWNTTSTNLVSNAAVSQLAAPALIAYINAITVGQPMNLFQLQTVFAASIASIVPPALLTRRAFTVSINGEGVSPESGTGIIAGDPESYFFATADSIEISQG